LRPAFAAMPSLNALPCLLGQETGKFQGFFRSFRVPAASGEKNFLLQA